MRVRDSISSPSVLGDFVLATGPDTAAWVQKLDGFTVVSEADEPVHAAVRGAAQHGRAADDRRFLAVADLIAGQLDDGVRALVGPPPQQHSRGRFAQVVWQPGERRVAALTDHFSTLPLYTLVRDQVLVIATDLRLLASSPWCGRTLDLTSVYHYLNFATIPAPRTIFTDIRRLEPSTRLRWQAVRGAGGEDRYFVLEYPEDLRGSDETLAAELRARMLATVQEYRPDDAQPWGCFLSGGTDSSSIVSILSKSGPRRVKSFSIGFAEEGYDELGFARIAAQACGADPSFHSVSRAEAQASVLRLTDAFDQPFGNASAIPTLACAELARRDGVQLLLAGDGGDEIFGGNERYAKDKVMEAWFSLPAPIKAMGRVVGDAVGGSSSLRLLNRVENFFERASLPNPDRFYTDDSFASDHYERLLRPEFRRAVERDASLDFMRGVYRLGSSGGSLHRVMRLDLMMAIAQNDLRKVDGVTRLAGVSVRFPYLDQRLVAYTSRLPERHKVRGLSKRYLFKRAMRGILPEEILRKKKQGFGLPISVWLRADPAFQGMVRDTLFDARARARGWWEPSFVEGMVSEHIKGGWDHSDYVWRLFVLELWLRRYVDAS
jgi:asparagine synthase (glutamine-hydrolysing)